MTPVSACFPPAADCASSKEDLHWSTHLSSFRHDQCHPDSLLREDLCTPLYYLTNEVWPQSLLDYVAKDDPTVTGNALICVAGLSMLKVFVSSTRFTYLINVDPDPEQKKLWEIFCTAIETTTNPKDALTAFIAGFNAACFKKEKLAEIDDSIYFIQFFVSSSSPFHVEGGYDKIKLAVSLGNIQSFCVNFNEPKNAERFAQALEKNRIYARAVYASNINADHWSSIVDLDSVFQSMNYLANPRKGTNVHFLMCAPSSAETCSCNRKKLRIVTSNHFSEVSGKACKKGPIHMMTLLDTLQGNFVLFVLAKYTPSKPSEHSFYIKTILEPLLNRVSLALFKEQFLLLCETNPSLKKAKNLFNNLYDHVITELQLEGLKERVFCLGLETYFPEETKKYLSISAEKKALTPKSVFIIELVFDTIRADLRLVMKQ